VFSVSLKRGRALGVEESMKKAKIVSELERSTLMEEVSWRQKSRILWLRKVTSAKFFHTMANSNRRRNTIDSLLIDGTISTNRSEISEHIVQFYKKLFTEQFSWRLMVDGLSFDSIDEVAASWLEKDFEEREVWEVVKTMNGDKAPGLDGYSMAFF
jgi:hypothetical protein